MLDEVPRVFCSWLSVVVQLDYSTSAISSKSLGVFSDFTFVGAVPYQTGSSRARIITGTLAKLFVEVCRENGSSSFYLALKFNGLGPLGQIICCAIILPTLRLGYLEIPPAPMYSALKVSVPDFWKCTIAWNGT